MQAKIQALLEQAIEDQVFPGAVVGYIVRGQKNILVAGRLTYDPDSTIVGADTIYDIASLTKVIPTNSLVLKLVEQGRLSLDDPVIKFISELSSPGHEKILIRHLLTYSVVFELPHGLSIYAAKGSKAIFDAIYHAPLKFSAGTGRLYTNAPIILAGLIVEKISSKRLDEIAHELLFGPLGMSKTTFHPDKLDKSLIAPTEIVGGKEIRGVVHDESAQALQKDGIIAGNAGLFLDVNDLLIFMQMLLDGGEYSGRRYFHPETIIAMHTNQMPAGVQPAGLGWHIKQPHYMGDEVSDQAFGKTGFTGPMILIDPKKQAGVVLLTNRTYPKRPANTDAINRVRRELSNIIFS